MLERNGSEMERFRGVTYIIIGLAVVGLLAMLLTNPLALLKRLATLLLFGVIIYTVIRMILRNKSSSTNEMKKYRQALKQSKQRYRYHEKSSHRKQINSSRRRRNKRPTHLRVIEGQKSKNKDKNRATF